MKSESINFEECLRSFYIGLDCQNIEEFMSRCTPENCFKLGLAYNLAVKEKLFWTWENVERFLDTSAIEGSIAWDNGLITKAKENILKRQFDEEPDA